MLYKALLSTLAALGAAALVATGSAGAADDVAPVPCNGVFATDKAGDQVADPFPGVNIPGTIRKGDDNHDLRELFFTARPNAGGEMQLTAHMVITNLTKDFPEEAHTSQVSYRVDFDEVNFVQHVVARNVDGEVTFYYAHYPETAAGEGTGILTETETTGSWIDGPMGVISIDLPPELSAPGVTLENVFARVSLTSEEEDMAIGYNTADLLPDDAAAAKKNYKFAECPAPVAEVTQTAETPVAAPVIAPPTVQAAPAAAPAPVVKKVSKRAACMKKAKKIKNKRKRAKAVKRCKKLKR